jgi:DNA-binding transcriptional MerR regulator
MSYTIHEIAKLAGVTLRTLRHYDDAGLLHPAKRSEAGYRLYTDGELLRLQQILFFKELDFPLKKIKEILSDPGFERAKALRMQADYLMERAQRYEALSRLAQKTLKNMEEENDMDKNEIFKGFDYEKMMEDQKKYEAEVTERWGHTDAYKVSKQRSAKYKKEDWERISGEQTQSLNELIALYKSGVTPEDEKTQAVTRKMHRFIHEHFYPCPLQFFGCLGEMYVTDERFTAFYDNHAEGLAAYYSKAIQYYVKHAQEL